MSIEKLLIAMNFLKWYQLEEVRSGLFKVSEKTVRKWGWLNDNFRMNTGMVDTVPLIIWLV
jgi:hypothetical protein